MWGDVLSRVSAGGGQSLPTAFLDEAQFQWLSLRQLDGRDRPLTILPLNRNPQRPWSSSSQTFATVPAFPSLRITALPTSSFSACSNSQRIAEARSFGVSIGDAASLAETRE